MSAWWWLPIGLAAWLVLSGVAALVVGPSRIKQVWRDALRRLRGRP